MKQPSLLIALSAGLLSFLSPCVLPLIPVYLASLVGPEIFEPKNKRFRLPIFMHALSFVIGFTIVFSLFGAGVGLLGSIIGSYLVIMNQIVGILLLVFGLFLIAAQKIPRLNFEKHIAPSHGTTISYFRSFLTGAIFTIAWTPCVGPILGSILTLALGSETAIQGTLLLTIYSLGLGLPFLVIGAAFDSLTPLLKRIRRYSTAIYLFSGVLLVAVGILILTNNLSLLVGTV